MAKQDTPFDLGTEPKVDVADLVLHLIRLITESPPADEVISAQQAAELLGCSTRHIYNLVTAGKIPHFHIGDIVRFRRSTLQAWMSAREQESINAVQTGQGLVHRLSASRSKNRTKKAIPPVAWPDGHDPEAG